MDKLRNEAAPGFSVSETATIFDALRKLEDWLISTLRARLPQGVVQALSAWLESQWRLYCVDVPVGYCWADYLWQYLRLVGDHELVIQGNSLGIIPPLVGRVEVHPVGLKSFEGDIMDPKWRHESIERRPKGGYEVSFIPANLCETLGYSFSERHPVCGSDGNFLTDNHGYGVRKWKRMDEPWQWPHYHGEQPVRASDGRIQMEDYDGSSLYLVVKYHGTSLAGSWLERMAGTSYYPAALQPRDHWVMRTFEVHKTMSENVMSTVLPSCVMQALEQFPRVKWEVEQCARAVAACRRCLLDPVWLDPATLMRTAVAARQQATEKDRNRKGRKRYDLATACFFDDLRDDNPLSSNLSASLDRLTNEAGLQTAGHVALPFDSWQEGILLAAELTAVPQHLVFARQQELLDAHRLVSAALENLLREVFQATRPTSNEPHPDKTKTDRCGVLRVGGGKRREGSSMG